MVLEAVRLDDTGTYMMPSLAPSLADYKAGLDALKYKSWYAHEIDPIGWLCESWERMTTKNARHRMQLRDRAKIFWREFPRRFKKAMIILAEVATVLVTTR